MVDTRQQYLLEVMGMSKEEELYYCIRIIGVYWVLTVVIGHKSYWVSFEFPE